LLAGCRSPTQITFVVTTDVPCARGPKTSVVVGPVGGLGGKSPVSSSTVCDAGTVRSVVVVPSAGRDAEVEVHVVMGIDGKSPETCIAESFKGTCIVAKRALHFLPHTELAVHTPLRTSCEGKICASDETCVSGRCVRFLIEDPSICTGTGCDETTLNPSADAGTDTTLDATSDGDADVGKDSATPTTTPMTVARAQHTATLLVDGRVLVAGGFDGTKGLRSSEIYDPATGLWTDAGLMPSVPWDHAADLLADGRVIAIGGESDPTLTQIWSKGTWSAGPPVPRGQKIGHAQAIGSVVVALGGKNSIGPCSTNAEVFDGTTNKWSSTSMNQVRCHPILLPISSTELMVVGGYDESVTMLSSAEIFDVIKGTWTPTTAAPVAISLGVGTVVGPGTFAFSDETDTMTYTGGTWSIEKGLSTYPASYGWVTARGQGAMVIAGGAGSTANVTDVKWWSAATKLWSTRPNLAIGRQSFGMTTLASGHVLVTGGYPDKAASKPIAATELISPP